MKNLILLACLLVAGALVLINVAPVSAAGGDLDTTFDPGSGADNTVFTTALQPDGKVVIGG